LIVHAKKRTTNSAAGHASEPAQGRRGVQARRATTKITKARSARRHTKKQKDSLCDLRAFVIKNAMKP
jgi:hypothetical protein